MRIGIESIASEDAAICKAVFFSKSGSSTGKPFYNNIWALSGESHEFVPNFCPSLPPFGPKVALCRAVLPFSSFDKISISGQPIKNSIISIRPKKHAFDNGHLPSFDLLLMFAPFEYKYFINSSSPYVQAQ
jgi:hypothetical protein